MSWINRLGFKKAAPVRSPKEDPISATQTTSTKRISISYENAIAAENAMQHPVVFRCLHKIAQSVQSVSWYVTEDTDLPTSQQASKTDIAAANALLKSPNDGMNAAQLRYWMALVFAVYGRVPLKVGLGVLGKANGLYPLYPGELTVNVDARGFVSAYEYGNGSNKLTIPSQRVAAPNQSYVSEFYTPTLRGALDQNGCVTTTALGSIGLPTQVVRYLLQRAADTASGHPNSKYIVSSEKVLTEKQKSAVRDLIENSAPGSEESGNAIFLYGAVVNVTKLDNDLSDIHSKMPLDDMARFIISSFGIPIALMGIGASDAAKFAGNFIESRRAFWEDTIIPGYLEPIQQGLTRAINLPGAVVMFDQDTIPAIADTRVSKAKDLTSVGFLTVNEKRELSGYKPIDGGDVIDKPTPAPAKTPTSSSTQ